LIDAFVWRHACKNFNANRKVSKEDLSFILKIARLSPSSFGFEPWKFLVFDNFDVLNEIRHATWGLENSLKGASHIIIILARKKYDLMPGSQYTEYMMKEVHKLPMDLINKRRDKLCQFFEKDIKAASEREIFDWASKQTYIAMANMLVAAAMLKIDTCPVEGFQYDKVEEFLMNKGIMDRKYFGVTAMISFGYRSVEPERQKTRQPIEKIVQYISL